jgi:hypothetical protein
MIARINLLTRDVPVRSPLGIVYSTEPVAAEGENRVSYITKGPSVEVVFAELVGCTLAREVGLPVPDVAAASWDGETYAAVARVEADRDVDHWLGRPQRVSNFADLFSAVVVDIWLANADRNMGNILGKQKEDKQIEFVLIDFEKSTALRPQPTVRSTLVEPRELWPTAQLGQALRALRPPHPPRETIDRIHSLAPERCSEIIQDFVAEIEPRVSWGDDSVHAIMTRADRIHLLAEEVWQAVT